MSVPRDHGDAASASIENGRFVRGADATRILVDRLPDSFALARSESEWLLTLLNADELRYIFEGPPYDENKN